MVKRSVTAEKIALFLGVPVSGPDNAVEDLTPIQSPESASLSFYTGMDQDVLALWRGVDGVIICHPDIAVPDSVSHVRSSSPRRDYARAVREFFSPETIVGISSTAVVHESAQIGERCTIGEYVVIEAGCEIGDDAFIGHHSVLHKHTRIGARVIVGANTVIGSTGFGLEKDEEGQWMRIPHLGWVAIEDDVEIGASCVIARGTIKSTVIGKGTKIDDQVFIAHNVQIEEDCVVIANAEVSGSVRVKRGSWLGPHSTIIEQVTIGENSLVGIGSVVIRDVPDNVVVAGNPSRVIRPRT